jgi:hypothetical protein
MLGTPVLLTARAMWTLLQGQELWLQYHVAVRCHATWSALCSRVCSHGSAAPGGDMALLLATAGSAAPVALLGYFADAAAGGSGMSVALRGDTAAAVAAAGVAAVMVALLRYQ